MNMAMIRRGAGLDSLVGSRNRQRARPEAGQMPTRPCTSAAAPRCS